MIAIDHSRYVLVALRHEAKFRREARLVLFLLPRRGFPVVCYSQQFSRPLSQNKKTESEELVRTERLPLQSIRCTSTCRSIYALLPADLVSAGVPAKMSTRENVHQSILRQRILIRRQYSPAKRSRENVHQPRIWTPNSLHFAHVVHFAHGCQNLLLSFDCRSDWFWGFCTRHKNQCLAHSSFSSCSLFEFSPFQRNAHDFAVWYRSSC